MGIVREPDGVNFIVDSRELKDLEKKQLSDIISHYKKTGKIKKISTKKENEKREVPVEK